MVPRKPAPLNPEPLSFATPVGQLGGAAAIEFEAPEGLVVAQVERRSRDGVRIRLSRSSSIDPMYVTAPPTRELGDLLLASITHKPLRAFTIPAGSVTSHYHLARPLVRTSITLVALTLLPFVLVFVDHPSVRALLAGLLLFAAIGAWLINAGSVRPTSLTYITPHGRYPFEHLLEDRPGIEAARDLVEQVKQEYGTLLGNIVYRIESPALFDPAVDTTRAFTTALIEWDNNDGKLTSAEMSTLAARIRLTFTSAREHAEMTGLDHVPAAARREVERAAKAARLATSSRSKAERASALGRAMKILESLRLYYMPSQAEVEAITGGKERLALPGRRRTEAPDES